MPFALARYGAMRLQEFAQTELTDLRPPAPVVLKTDRGTEYGWVGLSPPESRASSAWNGITTILRRATPEDTQRQEELLGGVRAESEKTCTDLIAQHKLPMQLVYAEHLLGNEKVFFYFVSETRVDFRNLVRELARVFQTRIELRQIGHREAAKVLGDCQSCGQVLCCRCFLRRLEPIPMSMARLQKQSLDPSKISGVCGKLKCCLRFEDFVYNELRRNLPERGAVVYAGATRGQVVNSDVYNQRVTITTEAGAQVTVPLAELRTVPPEAGAVAGAAGIPDTAVKEQTAEDLGGTPSEPSGPGSSAPAAPGIPGDAAAAPRPGPRDSQRRGPPPNGGFRPPGQSGRQAPPPSGRQGNSERRDRDRPGRDSRGPERQGGRPAGAEPGAPPDAPPGAPPSAPPESPPPAAPLGAPPAPPAQSGP